MGAGGAFTVGENEFGPPGETAFSFGAAGAELFAEGEGAELVDGLDVVGASSLVVLLQAESVPMPMTAAPPISTVIRRVSVVVAIFVVIPPIRRRPESGRVQTGVLPRPTAES